MPELPFFSIETGAYIGDTTHLSTIEHGAYLLMLLVASRTKGGTLPDDERYLAKITKLGRRWPRYRDTLLAFWHHADGRLINKRLSEERERVLKGGGSGTKTGPKSDANALNENNTARHNHNHNHNPPKPDSFGGAQPPQEGSANEPGRLRGRRLPQDWRPGSEGRLFALNEGLTAEEIDRIADQFRDYWHAKSGSGATKTDWLATWRVWIRKEVDRTRHSNNGREPNSDVAAIREVLSYRNQEREV